VPGNNETKKKRGRSLHCALTYPAKHGGLGGMGMAGRTANAAFPLRFPAASNSCCASSARVADVERISGHGASSLVNSFNDHLGGAIDQESDRHTAVRQPFGVMVHRLAVSEIKVVYRHSALKLT